MSYNRFARPRRTSCLVHALLPALALGGLAGSSEAVVITFTDRAVFLAAASALGPVQTEGFESQTPRTLAVGANDLGLVNLNIGLVPPTTTTSASISSSTPLVGTRDLSTNADIAFRTLDFTFDGGPILAAGFDYEGADTGGTAAARVDGQLFVFGDDNPNGAGFFGFISTTPLSGFAFEDEVPGLPTEIFNSDQFSFVTVVPEPATAGLLGAAGLMLLRRRRA